MKFHDFCPPYENPWLHLENFIIAPPLVHNVWLIMDSCWTTVLWSGSTKLCNRLCRHFPWFALKYFFSLDIKSLIDLKMFGATFGIGGEIAPLLATRLITPSHEFWNKFLVKWAQNQSLGEKWAATSKRLRSTELDAVKHSFTKLFRAAHGVMTFLIKIRQLGYFTKQRNTIGRGWKAHFTWVPITTT